MLITTKSAAVALQPSSAVEEDVIAMRFVYPTADALYFRDIDDQFTYSRLKQEIAVDTFPHNSIRRATIVC